MARQIPSPAHNPFPQSRETLRLAFNSVADQVRFGADEISTEASELSHRAETQAATLETWAAGLNEMNDSLRETAERAREAEVSSSQTRTIVQDSASIVRDAVGAMQEIERSSEQIKRIINVIDGIAFRTNLLALDAGVGAARAGDAGVALSWSRPRCGALRNVRQILHRGADTAPEKHRARPEWFGPAQADRQQPGPDPSQGSGSFRTDREDLAGRQ